MAIALPLLHLAIFAVISFASAKLSKTYQRGPIPLSPTAHLSWSVDFDKREISFALRVSDDALKNTSSNAWIGIGLGEDVSGGMLGADIFTAEFAPDIMNRCTVKDRHVPFAAYPLKSGIGPYPVEDSCQSDNSWYLVSCVREAKGMLVLEVKRPLKAITNQDRAIAPGEQVMMFAYGGAVFKYHKANRGSSRVVLYQKDDTLPPENVKLVPLPIDVEDNFTIRSSNYAVPNATTYACKSALLPVPKGKKRYMVAADHVLNSVKGQNMVHHFVVRQCRDTASTRKFLKTKECPEGAGSVAADGCSIIFTWAVGVGRFVTPDDVGFVIDDTNNMIIVESHLDNPTNSSDIVDNSGVRLHLSRKRKIEAGILILGDAIVLMGGQMVKNGFNYTSTCPSNCTAKWPMPKLNVFASLQHMHTTGKQFWTNRYNKDGAFNETTNSIKFWSNDHQLTRKFNPPKEILRGDTLSTSCNFDTSKKPDTVFGLKTKDEMFIEFDFVYPAPKLKPAAPATFFCGMAYLANGSVATGRGAVCGDANDPTAYNIHEKNPSFKDTVGIHSPFGNAPATCGKVVGGNTTQENQPTGAVCFPGSATVQTRSRGLVPMAQIRINDEVSVGNGEFSAVYMFTHRITSGGFKFVELETHSGEILRLSPGHHLYSNGLLVRADSVQVGDDLVGADGSRKAVVRASNVLDTGLYNPQTLHGNIAVNGIVTSTYTAAIAATAAHAMLAPLRMVQFWLGLSWDMLEKDGPIPLYMRRCLSS